MIPTGTVTTTKHKRKRVYISESDVRDGGGEVHAPYAVGSPEAAEAIQRVHAMITDPAELRRRQRTKPVGRALTGPSTPKPAKVPKPRSDPAVTAKALELRAEGRTWPEIGRALGEKPTNIRLRCRRAEQEAA